MDIKEDTSQYEDIINMPHHVSLKRPHMTMEERAAQFSSFAALTGHDEAVKETARQTQRRVELDEDAKVILDEKMQILLNRLADNPIVTIKYFVPDEKKEGGRYEKITGQVYKINTYGENIIMKSGALIPIEMISDMQGKIFDSF